MKNKKKIDPIYENRFSACGLDLLLKLLEIDPNKRITCETAILHSWFINFNIKLKKGN